MWRTSGGLLPADACAGAQKAVLEEGLLVAPEGAFLAWQLLPAGEPAGQPPKAELWALTRSGAVCGLCTPPVQGMDQRLHSPLPLLLMPMPPPPMQPTSTGGA